MCSSINDNERSWGIQLISNINSIVEHNDLIIKRAGGESTISLKKKNNMFPDVLLYGDDSRTMILQGWELKMPDVLIENKDFIKDAQRKALALGLNSCLLWNFTYAVLYVKNQDNTFSILKQWTDTNHIRTRKDVERYREDWERLLNKVIIDINYYFVSGNLHNAKLGDVISNNIITSLIKRNKFLVAQKLKNDSFRNSEMQAYINSWWIEVKKEYENDESDKYNAYAKTIILNWANRITFAHMIKKKQAGAILIDNLKQDSTPLEVNDIFDMITSRCDFYNIFVSIKYNDCLPDVSWQDFVDYSCFLKENGINAFEQEALQNILEGSIATSRRAINGQYTTPPELAKILVKLTVKNWEDTILDCCCGTGTIPKEALKIKKAHMPINEAVESVWACDKYSYPLQIANLSMTDVDTMNLANRIFQHNALTLSFGENVDIVDPETGEKMHLLLPEFGSITSNLPFVGSSSIPEDDKNEIKKMHFTSNLDGRSDLSFYIAIKLADILKPSGTLGIIVSNSWMGTESGGKFIRELQKHYDLKQIHISSNERWFHNADVVTTIMILEKKSNSTNDGTVFWLWNKSLDDFAKDTDKEDILISSAILESEINPEIAKMSKYSSQELHDILNLNISYNAFFYNVRWLLDIKNKIIPIKDVFNVIRGARRGWDKMFYPKDGEHQIESEYLTKVLLNGKNVDYLDAVADKNAFCCSLSLEELTKLGHNGAIEWINRFAGQCNKKGRPLPEALAKRNCFWYEQDPAEICEIFTIMNPDKRIFFAKFDTPSFINQRLIGLNHNKNYEDIDLNLALLNSMLTIFYIEASGFARGLGVLDVNKDNISECFMLNPNLVNDEDRKRILFLFEKIKSRKIMTCAEELEDFDRIEFEHEVLKCFGIDQYFDDIKYSLLSMQKSRHR